MVTPQRSCPGCGSTSGADPGYVLDRGQGPDVMQFIPGRPERGPLGGLKVVGRNRYQVAALCCRSCGLRSLYVNRDDFESPE